jgi:hypothetical protein
MRAKRMLRAIKLFLCWAMLCPPVLPLQAPSLGRLVIASDPPNATITINDKVMSQPTDSTFVVGPGTYSVAVKGGPGNLSCAAKNIAISAGQSVKVTCTKAGWSE